MLLAWLLIPRNLVFFQIKHISKAKRIAEVLSVTVLMPQPPFIYILHARLPEVAVEMIEKKAKKSNKTNSA